jgi:uncharacterized protein (DUF885 family)
MVLDRRQVVLALGSAALAPLAATPAFASAADTRFERLAARWIDQNARLAPIGATEDGDHRFDRELDDVSAAGRARTLNFAKRTLAGVEAIDKTALSRANQVDAALLANTLRAQIWTAEVSQDWAWNPLTHQSRAGDALYNLMAREFAPMSARLVSATHRLQKLPRLLAQARESLVPSRVPAPHAATYAGQNPGVKSIITDLIEPQKSELNASQRARLERAIATASAAIDEHQRWIEATLVPAAQADFRIGRERFDEKLVFTLQSSLSRQEIRQRADAAVISCRAEMYRVARLALAGRADAPATPDNPDPGQQQAAIRAALDIAAAERPRRDRLVEDATAGVEEARQFLLQRDLITLPDGPVRVILMPEFQRGVAVAYCDSPGALERNLETFYAISPIPDDWTDAQATSFLREYNTRGILDVGVHEAMPGHYVQIAHSNRYPSVLRALLGSGTFTEGWACYAEEMMTEQGFRADDPLYRLSQLKVQLRTITNAILDQAIQVDGMSQADAMRLMTETAFQEEREAAGKWRRAQLSSTQLSTYFVGFTEHLEARAEAQRRQGASFNLKSYHDGILSFGSPPVRYAKALLLEDAIV